MALSVDDPARRRVEEAVTRHIEEWAATIGLPSTDPRFVQFREEVTKSLHACMRAHIVGRDRRYERFSDLRRDFIALAGAAATAARRLRGVDDILKRLPPMHQDPAFRLIHDPQATAFEQDGLAEAARRYADECKRADRGGPLKMRAFAELAEGLICAYRHVRRKKGSGSARDGRLLKLVDGVLPIASELAMSVTGKPLQPPTSEGLGEYLHRIAERLDITRPRIS